MEQRGAFGEARRLQAQPQVPLDHGAPSTYSADIAIMTTTIVIITTANNNVIDINHNNEVPMYIAFCLMYTLSFIANVNFGDASRWFRTGIS